METTDTQRIDELERKINDLAGQVDELRALINPEPKPKSTNRKAAEALKAAIAPLGLTYLKKGRADTILIDRDGREHRIYLSASKNYGADRDRTMGGWHTINQGNADTTRFDAYLLSVEDERRTPVFFIFTPEEMRVLLGERDADAQGLRHFGICRDEPGVDRFHDIRDADHDMTGYRNAWNKLEFA